MNLAIAPKPITLTASLAAGSDVVTLSHRGYLSYEGEEYRLLSRKLGLNWAATRLEQNRLSANFQGSPLWPQQVLARYPSLLRHFRLVDNASENSCILPMPATINSFLHQLPDCEFKFQEFTGELSIKRYVDSFIDSKVLPMAKAIDRDSVHDWSYHFITLLFPEYLEGLRSNIQFVREHLDLFSGETGYEWPYYGHGLNAEGQMELESKAENLTYRDAIYRQMAIALDVATAKIVQILSVEAKGMLHKCQTEIQAIAPYLSGVNHMAVVSILWQERELPFRLANTMVQPSFVMDYVHGRLQDLNSFAKSSARRCHKESFTQVLSLLDRGTNL